MNTSSLKFTTPTPKGEAIGQSDVAPLLSGSDQGVKEDQRDRHGQAQHRAQKPEDSGFEENMSCITCHNVGRNRWLHSIALP